MATRYRRIMRMTAALASAGVLGIVWKLDATDDVLPALRAAARGETFISPAVRRATNHRKE